MCVHTRMQQHRTMLKYKICWSSKIWISGFLLIEVNYGHDNALVVFGDPLNIKMEEVGSSLQTSEFVH